MGCPSTQQNTCSPSACSKSVGTHPGHPPVSLCEKKFIGNCCSTNYCSYLHKVESCIRSMANAIFQQTSNKSVGKDQSGVPSVIYFKGRKRDREGRSGGRDGGGGGGREGDGGMEGGGRRERGKRYRKGKRRGERGQQQRLSTPLTLLMRVHVCPVPVKCLDYHACSKVWRAKLEW